YPWGAEALERARQEDKPIFLSIGYSACHWCHVMAHESFENARIAEFLNSRFVCIKVDREEHPELDHLYMEAVQMLSGHGGWPMSVFLTPELEPFFGGTYWPPAPRGPMPGFLQVLAAVDEAWRTRREDILQQARTLTALLRDDAREGVSGGAAPGRDLLDQAYATLSRAFDATWGGFGGAPKFPQPLHLRLLLRRWGRSGEKAALDMVRVTLDRMAAGGIYDHLGGGFHRYSTDPRWLVPHFEKMLYDNALLSVCYLEAWQATGDPRYARIVRETLDYVLCDMTDPAGGFHSTEDADSEGREGLYYLWTLDEVRRVLGPEKAETFAYVYDVTASGNFEGRNILNLPKTIEQVARLRQRDLGELEGELAAGRRALFEARSKRIRPGRDDKVVVAWNGLMIEALARAAAALGEPRYLRAARTAADFLLTDLRRDDGRLWHTWRAGRPSIDGFLDDYAALVNGLLWLYEAEFDERWIDEALRLAEQMVDRFADRDRGGFFMAAADHGSLIVRKKDLFDSATPSGGGLATAVLGRLGRLCGRGDFLELAERALQDALPRMEQFPMGTAQWLLALDTALGPTPEVVVLGSLDEAATGEVLDRLRRRYIPDKIVAFRRDASTGGRRSPALEGIFGGKASIPPGPTVYVCENFTCQAPVSGKDAALGAVAALGSVV
ncbi:MAG: thioredoxin domain-containing protein, partial [Thermoguttaceae bacterium]|nr:thioredoxin domain-containing protein [Thermoguttaceae bacterium]